MSDSVGTSIYDQYGNFYAESNGLFTLSEPTTYIMPSAAGSTRSTEVPYLMEDINGVMYAVVYAGICAFDDSTLSWNKVADMIPNAESSYSAGIHNGAIMVRESQSRHYYKYNISTGSWSDTGIIGVAPPLSYDHRGALYNGKLAYEVSTYDSSMYKYNSSNNTWQQTVNWFVGGIGTEYTLWSNRDSMFHVFKEFFISGNSSTYAHYGFKSSNDTWTTLKKDGATSRSNSGSFAYDGYIYRLIGTNWAPYYYNPTSSGSWVYAGQSMGTSALKPDWNFSATIPVMAEECRACVHNNALYLHLTTGFGASTYGHKFAYLHQTGLSSTTHAFSRELERNDLTLNVDYLEHVNIHYKYPNF